MPFRPTINTQIAISGTSYRFTEHPSAKGMPYGQTGRRATVYQVQDEQGAFHALKVFTKAFRVAHNATGAQKLQAYATLPGLQVCARQVITRQNNPTLLEQHPDLEYAVLMPWVQGLTWQEIMLARQPLTQEQSLSLAREFVRILATMEQQHLAHCDLSGPNLLIDLPALSGGGGVALVDVEDLYAPELEQPEKLPGGSSGYAHKTAAQGLWNAEADRFAGAVLLAEMLTWHDERVRRVAAGEQYFDAGELQTPCDRYQLLQGVLQKSFGAPADLLARAWYSESLAKAPTLADWEQVIGQETPQPKLSPKNINSSLTDVTRPLYESLKANLAAGNWQESINQAQALQLLAPGFPEAAQLLSQAQVGLEQEKRRAASLQRQQIAEEKAALQTRLRELEQAEQALPAAPVPPIQPVVAQPQPMVAENPSPTSGLWVWTPLVILGWIAAIVLLPVFQDQFLYYWDWETAGRMLAFLGLLGGFSIAWALMQEKYISSWKAGLVSAAGFILLPVLFPLYWGLMVDNWLEPAIYFSISSSCLALVLKYQNKSLSWISVGLMVLGWGLSVVISWFLTNPYHSYARMILYAIITSGLGWGIMLWRLGIDIPHNSSTFSTQAHTVKLVSLKLSTLWRWMPLVSLAWVSIFILFYWFDEINPVILFFLGGGIGGLSLAWALRAERLLVSRKHVGLVSLVFAVGWAISSAIFETTYYDESGFVIRFVIAGAIGGASLGLILVKEKVFVSWEQAAMVSIGVAVCGAIVPVVFLTTEGTFNEPINILFGFAISGASGWAVVVWQLQQARKVRLQQARKVRQRGATS